MYDWPRTCGECGKFTRHDSDLHTCDDLRCWIKRKKRDEEWRKKFDMSFSMREYYDFIMRDAGLSMCGEI